MPNFLTIEILKKIDEEKRSITMALSSGMCASYDEYKHSVGKLRGLNFAEEIVKDVDKRYERDED